MTKPPFSIKRTLIVLPVFLVIFTQGLAATRYVNLASTNSTAPYTSWDTAATNIQLAIDVAVAGDEILVTNGVYQTGGRIASFATNRVALTKPVTVRSLNGPAVTVIRGRPPGAFPGLNSVRCAYLTNGAALIGFTLTNGGTHLGGSQTDLGGGAWCESTNALLSNCFIISNSAYAHGGGVRSGTLSNCTLIGNSAQSGGGGAIDAILNNCLLLQNSATYGGGAIGGVLNNCILTSNLAGFSGGGAREATLNNCVVTGNSAADNGGGAILCTLNNCTVVGNSATYGGGTSYSTVFNCIVYYNSAPTDANNLASGLYHSCSVPVPSGSDSFTNSPLFVDYSGGNFRLQSNSPCINSGRNVGGPPGSDLQGTGAPPGPDLDGNTRIVAGTVDVGAYEFQSPSSIVSYAWLQQYGFPLDGSADHGDPDNDGFDNWQESRALTSPFDATSFLKIDSVDPQGGVGLVVTWQAMGGLPYFIERSIDLGANPRFTTIVVLTLNQSGSFGYRDTTATGAGPFFYRIRVE